MWQCPNCCEQHHDGFDICWKCGSDSAGNRDPGFRISEPVSEQDQVGDPSEEDRQLPSLRLPTITYFSIPPYISIEFITIFRHFANHQVPDFSISQIDILVRCIGLVLIGIPTFSTMVRAMFLSPNGIHGVFWMLSMFRLPETIRRSQRWFVPIYYASIGAGLISPLALGGWQIAHLALRCS